MASAADVPGKYDCVIDGHGYCFLDALQPNVPFRVHRAVYSYTPTFVERQNVSNSYGDNAQDFFQTIRQRDWSLGEQQKFFRASTDGRFYQGTAVDVTIPGQVSMRQSAGSATFAGAILSSCAQGIESANVVAATSSHLYSIDSSGTITDLGAHGNAGPIQPQGMATDGRFVFIASASGVTKYNVFTPGFSSFSATGVQAVAYLNNSLYGIDQGTSTLYQFSTSGVASSIFQWKEADGSARGGQINYLLPWGGKLLILWSDVSSCSELWVYDGAGVSKLADFAPNFYAYQLAELYGIVFISGSFVKGASNATQIRPAIMFFDGSQLGILWLAESWISSAKTPTTMAAAGHPAMCSFENGLFFTDETTGRAMTYNPTLGGVHGAFAYSTASGDTPILSGSPRTLLLSRNQTGAYYYPTSSTVSSSTVITSLIDFDSSLNKVFRGITVEFDSASDGNGGSVDIAYQIGSVGGSWTSLITGATSGTEIDFPTNVAGHSLSVKVTLNKGTSTAGPVLKAINVRAAPQLTTFRKREYILDLTGTAPDAPRRLRDGSPDPTVPSDAVTNLVAAAQSTSPITITDRLGTFTAIIEPDGFEVYEMHSESQNPAKSGSFVVRVPAREV